MHPVIQWSVQLSNAVHGHGLDPAPNLQGTSVGDQEQTLRFGAVSGTSGGETHSVTVRIREGGSNGVLQFKIGGDGQWDAVCDDNFDNNDNAAANAMCITLGYESGTWYSTTHGDHDFAVDDLHCPAGATHVSQCWTSRSPYSDDCTAARLWD